MPARHTGRDGALRGAVPAACVGRHPVLPVTVSRPLSVDEVNRIADLESREVLLAKLAGAMKGNLSKAAGLFAAPASQVARLAQALADKRAADAPAAEANEAAAAAQGADA